jgi:hypothetical protein
LNQISLCIAIDSPTDPSLDSLDTSPQSHLLLESDTESKFTHTLRRKSQPCEIPYGHWSLLDVMGSVHKRRQRQIYFLASVIATGLLNFGSYRESWFLDSWSSESLSFYTNRTSEEEFFSDGNTVPYLEIMRELSITVY